MEGRDRMGSIFAGREPALPLHYFEEVSKIPRGSYNEAGIADYLAAFAEQRGLWHWRDGSNNVVIKKPGSPGCEHLPPVVLQGHSDMVCEKNKDVDHDFTKDPIRLVLEGDILRADGTTLGADDGNGLAYMLAVLDDTSLVHPPLECLFTSMEEVGLKGAMALDPSVLEGRRMIGLDNHPEGGLLVSSAGGTTVAASLDITRQPAHPEGKFLAVRVRGLLGGHSGNDIGKERANACKLMGRVLGRLSKAEILHEVADIQGGLMHNAIPRECDAVLSVCMHQLDRAREVIAAVEREARDEYAGSDPGIRLLVEDAERAETTFDKATTAKLANLLRLTPNGRIAASTATPGLTMLSLNLATVNTAGDKVELLFSLRGAPASALERLVDDLRDTVSALGGASDRVPGYPAWQSDADSPLFALMSRVYRELRGEEPRALRIHAGVECAVIAEKIPGMDLVGTGPDCDGLHTPDEWLDLSSFGRVYRYLLAVLEEMTK